MNIALAILAALAFHLIDYLPETAAPWVAEKSQERTNHQCCPGRVQLVSTSAT
jgi:hypothetical protein